MVTAVRSKKSQITNTDSSSAVSATPVFVFVVWRARDSPTDSSAHAQVLRSTQR